MLGTPPSSVAEGKAKQTAKAKKMRDKEAKRNGKASCEGEEDAPEGPEAKGKERGQVPPEEKRRGCAP